jgi:cellulose synthase operon protein YhjU
VGLWSAYFLAKLLLYALGYIDFHPWENLAFAAFTVLTPVNARQRFAKNLLAVPIGILLLYHDSWLPPIAQALSQGQNLRAFSAVYLWELAGRIFSWRLIGELAAMLAIYALARRKLRMSTFVFIGIFAVALAPHGRLWPQQQSAQAATPGFTPVPESRAPDLSAGALDARLAQFYSEQQKIEVKFGTPAAGDPPFDILILHVCSLSWDDLKTLNIAPAGFFGRFDLVLSGFSSGASYSGPAAIRLLRGACGQTPEHKLYEPVDGECFVMDGLQNAGFEPHWLMNHDGHFGNFFGDVRDRGGMKVALEGNGGAAIAQQSFDAAPIYGDYETLSKWWAKRLQNPAPRVALYYNTISLHDGNRFVGPGHADSSYGARFSQFSSDIARFLDGLRASGRHVVVVFIAEHGAALAGDRRQISGLREIPTAAIARVPVAIALINAERPAPSAQERVEAPTSYPAVNELLARFIQDNPFAKPVPSLAGYTQALHQSDFVAENNGTTVMAVAGQYMMRSPDGAWSSLAGIER